MHGYYSIVFEILIGQGKYHKHIHHYLEEEHMYIIIQLLEWIKCNLHKHNQI